MSFSRSRYIEVLDGEFHSIAGNQIIERNLTINYQQERNAESSNQRGQDSFASVHVPISTTDADGTPQELLPPGLPRQTYIADTLESSEVTQERSITQARTRDIIIASTVYVHRTYNIIVSDARTQSNIGRRQLSAIFGGRGTEVQETPLALSISTSPCNIISNDSTITSQIWFRSEALDQNVLDKLGSIQLETKARDQGFVDNPFAGSWSWFEIAVLESVNSSEIKIKDGRPLSWLSHKNKMGRPWSTRQTGPLFERQHDIIRSLEVGNVLAVRVCAQFRNWENRASEARLFLRESGETDAIGHNSRQRSLLGAVFE